MYLSKYFSLALCLFGASDAISVRRDAAALDTRNPDTVAGVAQQYGIPLTSSLERRKGGGGKGGGGGGGGGKGGGGGSPGRTSPLSNVGGQTRLGTGVTPRFGGGKYYAGGASVPYSAGTPLKNGIAPRLLPLAGIGFLGVGGLWLYGAYLYPYNHYYNFINRTETNQTNPDGTNTTLPVQCYCGVYTVCACEENEDPQYMNDIIGNGSYAALNSSVVTLADYEGNKTIFINGTLENGTTAAGGVDDAASGLKIPYQAGLWALAAVIGYAVTIL